MDTESKLSSLNAAIDALNLAKEILSITPAKAVIASVSVLLTILRDSMVNELAYVELGLNCANICTALGRGMNGKRMDDLSPSVCEAINQLTTTVAQIQRKVIILSRRNSISRFFHAKSDKDTIAGWKSELNRILHVFNTELAMNTHVVVSDIRFDVSKIREEMGGQVRSQHTSILGESPPPPPSACFGRDQLIEDIMKLAERSKPIALIGAGGIGKTSIALTVLHHARIKNRFGHNRRFIRCDQFPASRDHLLSRLSKVIGAGIENPGDLTPLRPFLSSRAMILFLDNAESILDPQVPEAREMYAVVEELSRFDNICLGITSRISTIPPNYKRLVIPTLSKEAACDIFYRIYDHDRSTIIDDLVQRLDFHALSITLLATVASHNLWDYDRLAKEWETQRSQVLRTDFNESLAATIELSLSSPTFSKLGPVARELLCVVAFFPQGVDENNIDWLFPGISDRRNMFDKFCVLSLTHRTNGFITMLAPIRDYLCPRDPGLSSLLCATRDYYFIRLSSDARGAPWIRTEDVNVEHLLDVFTSVDLESDHAWDVCINFMKILWAQKPRPTMLRRRIEGLPNDHRFKFECLYGISRLFEASGNHIEEKRILTSLLKLKRDQGDTHFVARIVRSLSAANRVLGLYEEGIRQAEEALEIFKSLGDTTEQANCSNNLAWLFLANKQIDAAEEAAFRTIDLSEKGEEDLDCQSHRCLGSLYHSKGERAKAIHHFEISLGIASDFNLSDQSSWIHHGLALLFLDQDAFDDAHAHIAQAKTHAVGHGYNLGRATELQARILLRQGRLEEAKSNALAALELFEQGGALDDVDACRRLLQAIEG